MWDQGWPALRPIQEHAATAIAPGDRDVIVAAATASGKTEAAWLPIISTLAGAPDSVVCADAAGGGVQALYVSPLKALINDQADRLESLCDGADIPVHRWHGDVAASHKQRLRKTPSGVLLITPESLESLFVNHGSDAARILAGLRYVVIDELHAFIGTERGAQLQSLLHRTELVIRRRVPRIALSATLGDLRTAGHFLRPGGGDHVTLVTDDGAERGELLLQLRGYVDTDPRTNPDTTPTCERDIADHLFRVLRGRDNLVFANSRANVETYTDLLSRASEALRVPNEFHAHHGNLSKDLREHVEARLKDPATPTTAVCTSTLEMGIDIGSADSIAQIGAPFSVSALRQRIGRAGRRGKPGVLRMYITEPEVTPTTSAPDRIRAQLVQSIAMVDLLLDRWYEPPSTGALHLSTLTQQVLSVIAQRGGAHAGQLFDALCRTGPFHRVDQATFIALLRDLGAAELIEQDASGLLLHGRIGERLANHYSFYSAFTTSEEYRLVADGRTLGSLPIEHPLMPGTYILFGGRRWQVVSVDTRGHVIQLTAAAGGRPPAFSGGSGHIDDTVRRRMRDVYRSPDVPAYLDATATDLLDEGRRAFHQLRLHLHSVLPDGNSAQLFPWRGDKVMNTLAVVLAAQGHRVGQEGVSLSVAGITARDLHQLIRDLAGTDPPDAEALAATVSNTAVEKYDEFLSPTLAARAYAASQLDVAGAWQALGDIAAEPTPDSAWVVIERRDTVDTPDRPVLGLTPFSVIDVETTGFAAHRRDRVIELAIVHTDHTGNVTDTWHTLINPDRDPGPTHLHGITPELLAGAPRFPDVLPYIAAQLAGTIVVAHNALFDLGFLSAEFLRTGHQPPAWPALCTMDLAGHFTDARRLHDCCHAAGITLTGAHTALGDATATAALLEHYLRTAPALGVDPFESLAGDDLPLTAAAPCSAPTVKARTAPAPLPARQGLSLLRARAALAGPADPAASAYLDVLARALDDLHLSQEERHDLKHTAHTWGLDDEHARSLNRLLLAQLNPHLSEAERARVSEALDSD
ncbi:DEAD/DEAH box helicase [Phycicoccus sp. M110.8]|uniref:DEAD/DEAH box helicase n=1 Tax=Phycicoccus sp. M110.8 TaxID=3075433 RepID=UPI0028FD69BA|nr:DEAD/DEAH box helicase [Phycicoccus sp. M110.8]MDU0314105.1 DEAD/DEAH box helicase [Phycicoccus sp. M110.8]